jgi:hypothetical protein
MTIIDPRGDRYAQAGAVGVSHCGSVTRCSCPSDASARPVFHTAVNLATSGKTYKAEAIELSAPLWLGPEFLGLLKPARIGGVDLHVVLPDFKGDAGEGTVLHSRAQHDWLGFFAKREQDDDRDWPFGGVAKWQGGHVVEFSAHRLLALPKGQLTSAEARKLKLAVDRWVGLLETVDRCSRPGGPAQKNHQD